MDLNMDIRKNILLVSSLVECFVLGGPTYGWPSLVYVLRDRGYFSDLCQNSTPTLEDHLDYGVNRSIESVDILINPTCAMQDARLQLVFIIGSFGHNSGALIFGFAYDKFGTRVLRILSSILILLACLLFAFSSPSTAYLSFIALHLLATGGSSILITNSRVGNLFGNYRSSIVTLHAGVYASSAMMMLFVQIVYMEGISMTASFGFLAGVTVLYNINTFVLLPKYKIPWPMPSNMKMSIAVTSRCSIEDVHETELSELNESQSTNVNKTLWTDVEYQSLLDCLRSPMFCILLMWFSVIQITHLFYIGTINPRLQQLSNDNDNIISNYTTVYTALQATTIVTCFLGGLVLDRNKIKKTANCERVSENRTPFDDLEDSVMALLLSNFLAAAFNICSMIPVLQVQFLTFIFQITGRAYLFALLLSFIAMAFPTKYFGSIYGTCRVLAALFTLLQYPLFQMVQQLFNENPFYVDLMLLVVNIFSLAHPLYVYSFVSKRKNVYKDKKSIKLTEIH